MESLETRIRRNLGGVRAPRRATTTASRRRAAVAVCVLDAATAPRVLIAKRVPRGLNAGQWALPGGKLDPGEDAVTAALRELHEEAGLDVAPAAVAGLLDDVVTDSGFCITPVVVLAPPGARPVRNPAELASLHPVPLANLEAEHVPRWATHARRRPAAADAAAPRHGHPRADRRDPAPVPRGRAARARAADRRPRPAGVDAPLTA